MFCVHSATPLPACSHSCSTKAPPDPRAHHLQGSAEGSDPGPPPPAPSLPFKIPSPPRSALRGNVGMGKVWGGNSGGAGQLRLQNRRLRGIPAATGPCREVQRGWSQAAPSGAQQQDQRRRAHTAALQVSLCATSEPPHRVSAVGYFCQ